MRTSICSAEKHLLKQYDDTLKKTQSKVTNVCFTGTRFTQSVLLSSQSGLGVSSAQPLALPAFLASAVGAREALEQHFGEEFEHNEFNFCLEEWFAVTGTLETPDNEHLKNWSKNIYPKVLTDLLPELGEDGVKRLNFYQYKFASQWLNVIPCETLILRFQIKS